MEKEVLEAVLMISARESCVHRILEIDTESALPKGENYTSNIFRIRMKVVLGNGRIAKRSLIVKKAISGEAANKMTNDFNLYYLEARMYSEIFKEMEILMEECEEHEEPLWCKFIFYDPQCSSLVLEDLKAVGFRLVQRQIGLDLDHSLLALRNLGRYHAMAKVLEDRGLISKDDYKPQPLLTDSYYIKMFSYAGVKSAAEGIRSYWGPEWEFLADRLSVPLEVFEEKMKDSARQEEMMFACLNHGDCWSNNMMFRYDWQKRPVSVKFLDYQFPHYNTPCVDVTNFIYMSIQPRLRRQNYRHLLEIYHGSLTMYLDKYGYLGPKPSLEEIEKVMERLSFFGLTYFAGFYPVTTCKSTAAMDVEKIFQSQGDKGFNLEIYKEEGMIERLVPDLTDFAEKLSAV